jgi:hypothetical protein
MKKKRVQLQIHAKGKRTLIFMLRNSFLNNNNSNKEIYSILMWHMNGTTWASTLSERPWEYFCRLNSVFNSTENHYHVTLKKTFQIEHNTKYVHTGFLKQALNLFIILILERLFVGINCFRDLSVFHITRIINVCLKFLKPLKYN